MAGYRTLKAPGGTIHVYEGGRRVFVKAQPSMRVGTGTSSRPRPVPGVRPLSPVPRAPSAPSVPLPGQQPVAAAPGFTPAAPVTATPLGSPTDASYLTDLAQIRHRVNTQNQQLDAQGVADRAQYTESSRRYNEQEPLAQQNADEGYNHQGLLYSGHLGQEKGRLATQYARTRSDMLANFTGAENARAEARRQLAAGATLEEASLAAAAADRQTQRDQDAADRNALVPNQGGFDQGGDPQMGDQQGPDGQQVDPREALKAMMLGHLMGRLPGRGVPGRAPVHHAPPPRRRR